MQIKKLVGISGAAQNLASESSTEVTIDLTNYNFGNVPYVFKTGDRLCNSYISKITTTSIKIVIVNPYSSEKNCYTYYSLIEFM